MQLSEKEKNRLKTKYGPWAVITGASSGIGKALVEQLGLAGLNLLISGRNEPILKQLKSDIEARHQVRVAFVVADLSDQEGVQKIIATSQGLAVGLFIASAGFGSSGRFLKTSVQTEVNMLRVNCEALLVLTHHFARHFAQQQSGGIILMSSMVGFQGVPYAANYAATKAYVQSLAEALAEELSAKQVDVLAVAPGPVQTAFGERAQMKMGHALQPIDVAIPALKALGRQHTVLPGGLTKVLVYALRTLPRWGKIKVMKQVMSGMAGIE